MMRQKITENTVWLGRNGAVESQNCHRLIPITSINNSAMTHSLSAHEPRDAAYSKI